VLTENVTIQHHHLPAGSNVLVVLAAANRDPHRYKDPGIYNVFRNEDPQYLTFGEGEHRGLAEHFSIHMAASAFHYIFSKYKRITPLQAEVQYEPRINVRLPTEINFEVL
jgi:cytochrome P450